jgi:pimeloyl-ACP methyl ester carboxylesterase
MHRATTGRYTPDTVILVHGLWTTAAIWDDWVARFVDRGMQVIVPSWPGLGGSVEDLRADPAPVTRLTIPAVIEHVAKVVCALDRAPIIMGHCYGGLVAQVLLDRGLCAAGVGIASVPPEGVHRVPLRQLRAELPALEHVRTRHRAVALTARQFHRSMAPALDEAASDAEWRRLHVPAPGSFVWHALFDSLAPGHHSTWIDWCNIERAPLLLLGGDDDRLVPPAVLESNVRHYRNPAVLTDSHPFPGRSHLLPCEPGWEEVADRALEWSLDHARSALLVGH